MDFNLYAPPQHRDAPGPRLLSRTGLLWEERMMRCTVILHAPPGFPSFWKRSLNEFKRLSQVAINLEGLEKPKNSFTIWDFSDPDSVKACVDMSDQDIGGSSNASFVHVPASSSEPAHAHFSGHISNELPKDDDNVQRTGYAAWRTEPRPATMFGKSLWDVEHYKYLGIRLKSDSRKYKVNVQTESVEYTDLHQHRLYVRHPGQWETVLIRWEDFVRTNHGIIVEPQSEMLRNQVRTIGVGLTDRLPGAFDFRISNIWATNGPEPTDGVEYENPERRFIPRELKMPVGAVPKQVGFEAKKGA